MPQSYSTEDDRTHIEWLLHAFADPRYIKIDGRPLFLIYRPSHLPDPHATFALWRKMALEAGLPGLFLCSVLSFPEDNFDPSHFGLDAAVQFKPNLTDCGELLQSDDPLDVGYLLHQVKDYSTLAQRSLEAPVPGYPFFPSVCPSWDNTARRKQGAVVFRDATPDKYRAWLEEICYRERFRSQSPSLVFVNAWNEWAEGNHLEPCQKWGHAYLQATKEAIESAQRRAEAIDLRRYDIEAISRTRATGGTLEYCRRTPEGLIEAGGWTVWLPSATPPSLILFAEDLGDDRMRLLHRMDQMHLLRPDVSAHLQAKESTYTGWHGCLPLELTPQENPITILAYDVTSREFSLIARVERLT